MLYCCRRKMYRAFLLAFLLSSSKAAINLNFPEEETFSEITRNYPGYQLIVHYDNITFKELRFDARNVMPAYLNNFDLPGNFLRPEGHKYVHLVFLDDPFRFERFSREFFNLEYWDVVVFLMRNVLMERNHVWEQEGIDRARSVILYDLSGKAFYYVKFFVGTTSGILNKVERGNEDSFLLRYINDFNDFNGHLFKVGHMEYKPFIWCRNKNKSNSCDPTGVEGHALKQFSQWFNFTFRLISFDKINDDQSILIDKVYKKEIDWAIGGITATLERNRYADFLVPLQTESYAALISTSQVATIKWGRTFMPFKFEVWLHIIVFFIIISCLFKLAYNLRGSTNSSKNFLDYIMIPVEAFLEQSVSRPNTDSITLKLAFGTVWFAIGIILTSFYKTKLTSTIIKPKLILPYTMKELLLENYEFETAHKDWSVLNESSNSIADPTYKKIFALSKSNLTFCDSVLETVKRRVAFIREETALQYEIFKTCDGLFTAEEIDSFRLIKEKIFPNLHSWPMQLCVPYMWKFSRYILQLSATGHIKRWYERAKIRRIPRSNNIINDNKLAAVKLANFWDIGKILVFGFTAAVLTLFGENIYFYQTN